MGEGITIHILAEDSSGTYKNCYKPRKGQNTNRKMDKGFEQPFIKDDVKMANKTVRCSTSLDNREMQIKTTLVLPSI